MHGIALDPAYRRLKDSLIASTGLAFYADRDSNLSDLIANRLFELGLRDCPAYENLLADGDRGEAEMDVLIAQLTIGETCFFRDQELFDAIREVILPDIFKRNHSSRQLHIWSAGCATGAEPYSVAILLAQKLAGRTDWSIDIHATDLNRQFLKQAAEGKFRPRALRCTPEELKRECFSNEGRTWTIDPKYKQWVSFHPLNLVEFALPSAMAVSFDLILCRNVMIYFNPEVNRRLIEQFHQALGAGGWLVVGGAEHNQENFKAFRTLNMAGATLYQKVPLPMMREAPPATPEWRAPLYTPYVLPAETKPPGAPAPVNNRPGLPPAASGPAKSSPDKPALLGVEGLRLLADCGDWEGAAGYAERLLAQDKLNPSIHYYQALIFENLGIREGAKRSLRQAIYLDRGFALAHYHLGLALKHEGQTEAAARSFGNVLKVVAGMRDDAAVASGLEVTVAALRQMARKQLENPNKIVKTAKYGDRGATV